MVLNRLQWIFTKTDRQLMCIALSRWMPCKKCIVAMHHTTYFLNGKQAGKEKNILNFLTSRGKITTREGIPSRRSSVVEQLIRNQQVVSSILTAGSIVTNWIITDSWRNHRLVPTAFDKRHQTGLCRNFFLQWLIKYVTRKAPQKWGSERSITNLAPSFLVIGLFSF